MSRLGDDEYESDPLLGTNIQYIAGRYDNNQDATQANAAPSHGSGNSWLSRYAFKPYPERYCQSTIPHAIISSSSIIVAQMLGAGVLGLPGAVKQMGWFGAIVVLLLITTFSM
jgi:hypothetical protein